MKEAGKGGHKEKMRIYGTTVASCVRACSGGLRQHRGAAVLGQQGRRAGGGSQSQ